MSEQIVILWLSQVLATTSGTLFEQCEKLLWSHCTFGCSSLIMLARHVTTECVQYSVYHSSDGTSCWTIVTAHGVIVMHGAYIQEAGLVFPCQDQWFGWCGGGWWLHHPQRWLGHCGGCCRDHSWGWTGWLCCCWSHPQWWVMVTLFFVWMFPVALGGTMQDHPLIVPVWTPDCWWGEQWVNLVLACGGHWQYQRSEPEYSQWWVEASGIAGVAGSHVSVSQMRCARISLLQTV